MFNRPGSTSTGQASPLPPMMAQMTPVDRRAQQMMQAPPQQGAVGMAPQPGPIQTPTSMPQAIPLHQTIQSVSQAIQRRLAELSGGRF